MITAHFDSDFSEFEKGVKKAQGDLSSFESQVQSFGRQLAGALGVGISVGALVGYTRAVIAAASETQRMADVAGIAVDQMERLQYVANQTSTPVDALTKAFTTLQQRIGSGDAGAVAAARDLGIEWEDLKNASPYDALVMVATAAKDVTDRNRQMADGTALVGKSFTELGPAIRVGLEEASKGFTALSEASRLALNKAEADTKTFWENVKHLTLEGIGTVLSKYQGLQTEVAAINQNNAFQMKSLEETMPPVIALHGQMAEQLKVSSTATKDMAHEQRMLDIELRATMATNEAWEKSLKAWNDAKDEAKKRQKKALEEEAEALFKVSAANFEYAKQTAATTEATLLADKTTKTYYMNVAAEAKKAFDFAIANAADYTPKRIALLEQEKLAAEKALQEWGTVAVETLDTVKSTADQAKGAIDNVTKSAREEAMAWGMHPGGQVANSGLTQIERFGQRYLANPETGEIVAPLERKFGASGFIGWGEATHNTTVNVAGNVLGTQDELARLINNALTDSYRRGGNVLPA